MSNPEPVIYQFKVVLQGISPMIWRRLLICDDNTIADLHYIIQIAMGWSDDHLHQFRIHGKRYENTFRALQTVSWLQMDTDADEPTEKQKKPLKKLEEFETYICNNAGFIPNYGERRRYGEAISTAFVESTINQVVSRRMVKKQQMRWSQQGAHL